MTNSTVPRWISEAFDVMMAGPGVGDPEVDKLAKALIDRLPIEAMIEAGNAYDSPRDGLDLVRQVVVLSIGALTSDPEVITLTELYQNAARALDLAGVPYAIDTGPLNMAMAARIRWLAAQRPTRIDLEREVATAVVSAQAAIGELQLAISTLKAKIAGLEGEIAELEVYANEGDGDGEDLP